ncbi:hypothetical protein [Tepidiforma thermophila]|uniref:Uncharacterized protein n=1 Tax=Tepidiforma thermophila (strain KCTC 52669 / CGMCC 1.13589 / G233) TaxID=2761530 RepID=A0A2A9HIA7_TEPT2|nr:hypothetical protein [Tepidiforma thermophila]PFG74706.1 hypothetical protein A9A59_1946 [Tepidiforma thermophila]
MTVNTIIAGWAMGYAMSIISTFALTYIALQPGPQRFVQRIIDPEVPGALLAVPISIGTGILWTMGGLVLASLYLLGDFSEMPPALGAPSGPWLLLVAALGWLPVPVLWLISRRLWWLWLGTSGSFIFLFGWAMPLLGER